MDGHHVPFPILQTVELITLIIGGFFAIFEYRRWEMPFLSGVFYLIGAFANIIFYIAIKRMFGADLAFFIVIAHRIF